MLAKLTEPAVPEVRAVAAMVGAARSDKKEEWESDSGATFHMSHTAGTSNVTTSYQQWVWEREANIDWSMVICQGSTRSELP